MIGQVVAHPAKDDSRYLPESMDIVHCMRQPRRQTAVNRETQSSHWWCKVNIYVNQLLLPRFAKSAFVVLPLRRAGILSQKKPHLAVLTTILRACRTD